MNHIPKSQARRFAVDPAFTINEYGPLGGGISNGTVAEVRGRYPAHGYGMNVECDEVVYVISGSGKVVRPDGEALLAAGDVAFVPKGQKIAWDGEMDIFIPCIPGWSPQQHVFSED